MEKTVSQLMIVLLLVGMSTSILNVHPVKAVSTTIIVPDNYPTIQEAINNSDEGDTIYVKAGTYYENVVLDKQNLTLIGEDKYTTIIDGAGKSVAVYLKSNNTKIEGFTVRNAYNIGIGMYPWTCGHIIHDNVVLNNTYGISGHYDCVNISICDNIITSNNFVGIEMLFSHSIISHNLISENGKGDFQGWGSGIQIQMAVYTEDVYCVNNTIFGNTITGHQIGIWGIQNSEKNLFYHNNFVNNTIQIRFSPNTNNSVIENYWNNYAGTDMYRGVYQNETGSDGLGDTPYIIDANNRDQYPLMTPWTPPRAPTVVTVTCIEPHTLKLKSKSEWITAYVELPEGYNVSDVDVSTIRLNMTIPAELEPTAIGDHDNDTIPDLLVKFNRTAVSEFILSEGILYGNATLTVTGKLDNGAVFEGSDAIRVRMPGDINMNGRVDGSDIAIAAWSFGSYGPDFLYPGSSSSARWNPVADENENNRIDGVDVATVARGFGKTYI